MNIFTPIAPTNLRNEIAPELLELADEIHRESASLTGGYSKIVLDEVRDLLRKINSYYSNRIESDGTHPINIEKAMRQEYSKDSKEHALQLLSVAHIEAQKEVEKSIQEGISPFSGDFIRSIHHKIYSKQGMEGFLDVKSDNTSVKMVPGFYRERDVAVGSHIAPPYENIVSMMSEFQKLYGKAFEERSSNEKLIYALSSHHRLAWIHPFLDGNGRTSRLALDAAISASGVQGYGLWNISRGLARNIESYRDNLKYADMVKQGSLDGNGALSSMALKEFVSFMLKTSLDQIKYMQQCLKIDLLQKRIETYVSMSQKNMLGIQALPKRTDRVFMNLLIKGSSDRGELASTIGVSERMSSVLYHELLSRGFLKTESPKGSLSIAIPSHMASYVFPELIPVLDVKEEFVPKRKPGRPSLKDAAAAVNLKEKSIIQTLK